VHDADALFEQAQAAEETGNIAEAERLYGALMECDPDAAPPFNLGNMLRSNGRRVEAEAALRAATRTDPTFAEAWYNLSDLLDEHGRSDAAIDRLFFPEKPGQQLDLLLRQFQPLGGHSGDVAAGPRKNRVRADQN
jgi:tetratricopeptide (TPR) repeat protein